MHVRQAENSDEVWLLDELEACGIDDQSFRSRDYVIAIHPRDGEPCGAGRIRYHTVANTTVGELANLVIFTEYHDDSNRETIVQEVVHELARKAASEDVERLYHPYPSQHVLSLGGEETEGDEFGVEGEVLAFDVDSLLPDDEDGDDIDALAEEFGYDDETTTKYSVD